MEKEILMVVLLTNIVRAFAGSSIRVASILQQKKQLNVLLSTDTTLKKRGSNHQDLLKRVERNG
jgi:hypothetical protein